MLKALLSSAGYVDRVWAAWAGFAVGQLNDLPGRGGETAITDKQVRAQPRREVDTKATREPELMKIATVLQGRNLD